MSVRYLDQPKTSGRIRYLNEESPPSDGLTGPTAISARPRFSMADVFPTTTAAVKTRQKLPATYGASAAMDFLNLLATPTRLLRDVGHRTGVMPQQPLGARLQTALRGGEQRLEAGEVPPTRLLGQDAPDFAINVLLGLKAPGVKPAGRAVAKTIEQAQVPRIRPKPPLDASKLLTLSEKEAATLPHLERQEYLRLQTQAARQPMEAQFEAASAKLALQKRQEAEVLQRKENVERKVKEKKRIWSKANQSLEQYRKRYKQEPL